MINRYNQILSDKKDYKSIKINSFLPKPNEEEYRSGYIVRYFIQSSNNQSMPVYEVDINGYRKYTSNPFFTTVELDWRLTGELESVKSSNKESIRIASQTIPNLKYYLPNLLQFYKK